MKKETAFRKNKVLPFLKKLKNAALFPIQQASIKGDPDYILCINGKFVALELKDVEGEVRVLQKYKLDMVSKARGLSFVASPDNWNIIKQKISNLDKGGM